MNLYTSAGPHRSRPLFDRGTTLRTEGPVFVIGAVNMDLTGTPAGELRPGDSNPGKVVLSPGGVGRNIAENLRLLGRKVSLITITGEDAYGDLIRERCRNAGIDMQYSFTDPMGRTSTIFSMAMNAPNSAANMTEMVIFSFFSISELPFFGQKTHCIYLSSITQNCIL